MNNPKYNYSISILLLVLTVFFSCQIFAQQKINRSENSPGSSLASAVSKLKNSKLNAKADIVTKLGKSKDQSKKDAGIIKNNIKVATKNNKASNPGIGGLAENLSDNDSSQPKNSKDTGQIKVNVKSEILQDIFLDLVGIGWIKSMYKGGIEAKKKAYLAYLDEYQKAGEDITDPKIINKALLKATGKGLLISIYEGAKCIPLVGGEISINDLLAVHDLTESSVGLVYDTLESNKIRKENKDEQNRQAGASIAKLERLLNKAKTCRNFYEKQAKQADDLAAQFQKVSKQYIEVQNRDVKRTEKMADTDKLEKACKTAKPFLEDKYLKGLKDNSAEMDRATGTTLKLAETTLENYLKNPDPAPLKRTSSELTKMMGALLEYKEECNKIVTVLKPISGGQNVLEQSQALDTAANNDAIISSNLMQNATDLVKLYRSMVVKCQKLQTAQQQIKARFDNAYNYFSIRSKDNSQNQKMNDLKNDLIGVMIKDYELKGMKEKSKSLAGDLRYWHKPIQPTEGMDPALAEIINKASTTQPDIALLQDSLANRIEEVKAMLQRLNNPDTIKGDIPDYKVKKGPELSDHQMANISGDEICRKASYLYYENSKPVVNRTACGFKYYKMNAKEFQDSFKNSRAKAIPYYIGSFRKLLEKGTVTVWYDLNGNGVNDGNEWRQEPYWIWYESIHGCDLHMQWYYRTEERINKIITNEQKKYNITHAFIAPNVQKGFVGIKEGISPANVKKSYKFRHYNGFAMYPPFSSSVHLRIAAQFGPYLHYDETVYDDEKLQVWQYLKNPEKMKEKVAVHQKGIEKQIKEMLNESLTLPKQFTDFSKENYYFDIREIFPNCQFDGFKTTTNFQKYKNYSSIDMSKEKTWQWQKKANVRYYAEADIRFPSRDESWNELLKRIPENIKKKNRLSKQDKSWQVNLQGAACVRGKRRESKREYTNRKTKNKYPVYSVNETIYFSKSNIEFEVKNFGYGLPKPELDTQTISQQLLNKVRK